jgi:hypothetical protein
MDKMPDTLNTKKEIDEYYKTGWKELKLNNKANKADKKKKDGVTKRVKKVIVDEDGNEIVKEKKPPTEYQQFMRDTRPEVKEKFPELKNNELFAKIAELWAKHKEDKIKNTDKESDTDENVDDDKNNDVKEDKKDDDKKTTKGGKAPRKALGTKAITKKESS